MAGSTVAARELVDGAVQRTLTVGDSLSARTLQEFRDLLGLADTMGSTSFRQALQSLKYNSAYRRASCFDLSDMLVAPRELSLRGPRPPRPHLYVLTRRK